MAPMDLSSQLVRLRERLSRRSSVVVERAGQ
jgi:hypothetical protein